MIIPDWVGCNAPTRRVFEIVRTLIRHGVLETRSSKGTHLLDESPNGAASRGTKKRKTAASPPPETASEPVQQTTEVIAENEEDAPSDPIDMESEYNMMPQLGLPPDFAALDNGTTNPYTPDLDAAISNIIGHSERLDAHALMSETNPSNSKGLVYVKTGSRMKVESLPILDNLVSSNAQPFTHRAIG